MPLSFRIGQIVEIISPPDGSGVQKGDLGTVASEEYRHMDDDNWRIDILWHRLGERRVMMTPMIRLYDDPTDRPNRSAGAGETVRPLYRYQRDSPTRARGRHARSGARTHGERRQPYEILLALRQQRPHTRSAPSADHVA